MSHQLKAIFFLLTIVAVLFVSAVGTTNVYADDGTPPPPPTETGEVDPSTSEAEPVATEPAVVVPPAEEPVATEAAVTEAPVVEEAPAVEEQPAEAAPILEQVPDNTTVTVLNAEGEAQPLTSQESADAILTSDPVWCPAGQNPGTLGNNCTPAQASFTDLLSLLEGSTTYTGAGTIYVQMGAYAGPETVIDFDAYDLSNISSSDLTVQGGWDPTDNSTDDTTTLDAPIVIGMTNPWVGSLTFNNIYISNVSNQTGLTLVTEGSITLNNVQVTNSLGGADLDAGGSVSVQNSKFNENKKFGAKINAGGYVEVTNSEFNNNADDGQDDGFGLKVDSQDWTLLAAVSANFNEEFGADINSTSTITVWNSVFSGNVGYTTECKWQAKEESCHQVCVKVANGSGYGLKAVSTGEGPAGDVYLQRVTANDNYLFGAHLEGTTVTIEGEEVDGVIVGNTFNGNGSGAMDKPTGYGLEIISTMNQAELPYEQKAVTLSNVQANNNQVFGANIKAVGDVVISNSFFDGNKSYHQSCSYKAKSCHDYVCTKEYDGYGLQVVTTGGINLYTVSASDNHLFGARLKGANVGIFGGTFDGNGSGNNNALTGRGLEIESGQNVNLVDVTASNNQAFGADIQAVDTVNITHSVFSGQQVYEYSGNCTDKDKQCHYEPCVKKVVGGGYGLHVVATGANSLIQLTVVTASDNYLYGMHLVASRVNIASDETGEYNYAENNKEGVKIEAKGSVSIDKLQANNNKLFGADILTGASEVAEISISQSFFNGNASYISSSCKGKTYYGYGLRVVTTDDDVTLTNVQANDNNVYGAYLQGANVSVTNGVFSSNGTTNKADHIGSGLEIVSTGSSSRVNLYNVTASDNQLFGAKVKADGLVVVENSVFSGNQSYTGTKCSGKTYDGYGLQVVTTGSAYLYSVAAEENYLYGAHVEGSYVSVNNSVFSNNVSPTQSGKTPTGRGLEVKSTGDVSLESVDASNNQLFGATIEADGAVSVISSTFLNNKYYTSTSCKGSKSAGYGLKVVTIDPAKASPIVLEGVDASSNGAEGAILQGESTVEVTDSTFSSNGADGLKITASGDVTLTNVTAEQNKGDGVEVTGICTNTVNVYGGTFQGNSKYGIKIVDANSVLDGMQTFTNGNGSGNVFQSDCVVVNNNGSNNNQNNSGQPWWNGNHGHGHH